MRKNFKSFLLFGLKNAYQRCTSCFRSDGILHLRHMILSDTACRLTGWWSNNRDIRLTNMGKGKSCDMHVTQPRANQQSCNVHSGPHIINSPLSPHRTGSGGGFHSGPISPFPLTELDLVLGARGFHSGPHIINFPSQNWIWCRC